MEYYRPHTMDGYSTYLPVLSALVQQFEKPDILEFGAGWYSTPLVQAFGGESIERNPEWLAEVKKYYPRVHDGGPRKSYYDICLVDSAPLEERRRIVLSMMNRCNTFILHDALPAWENQTQYQELQSAFKYSYIYKALCPWTLIVSTIDLNLSEKLLWQP